MTKVDGVNDRVNLYPQNPNYGSGVFRRGVRLTNEPGKVFGELEDTMHAMRCTMTHENGRITSVTPEFTRLPMDTCPGAAKPLQSLVGLPLDTPLAWFYGEGRPRLNCTHLYDLSWWMIAHANRDEHVRKYEVVVPDNATDEPGPAMLFRNGEKVLELQTFDGLIHSPEPFAGRLLLQGFTPWVVKTLAGDELEAALVLQKGYFTSSSQRVDTENFVGPIINREAVSKGVCWSYSSPRFEKAIRVNSYRDMSNEERLLKFRDGNVG